MQILLTNIQKAIADGTLTENQALYMIYMNNHMEYPIDTKDIVDLLKKKYIIGTRVGTSMITEQAATRDLSGTIKAKYIYPISKDIVVELCRLVCPTDGELGIIYPGEDRSIKPTVDLYLGNEGLIAYHYVILLYMFPIKSKYNRMWERQFTGKEYKGPSLRTRSVRSGQLFKSIAREKDMGVFLYGTYLYIKDSINDGKPYIKTINNYLNEYSSWYDRAEAIIKTTQSVKELFKRELANEGRVIIGL